MIRSIVLNRWVVGSCSAADNAMHPQRMSAASWRSSLGVPSAQFSRQWAATGSAAKCLIAGLCSFGELEWRLLTDSICPVIASLMVFRQRNAFLMAPLAAPWLSLIHSNTDALRTTRWPLGSQTETFALAARPPSRPKSYTGLRRIQVLRRRWRFSSCSRFLSLEI